VKRRSLLAPLLVLALISPAFGWVDAQDLDRAAAELERARAAAGEAGAALAQARREEGELRATLEALVDRLAGGEVRLREAREDARESARALYVAAGSRLTEVVATDSGERRVVRAAYAAAVEQADREAVNALVAAVEDLERRREQIDEAVAARRVLTERLAELERATGPALVQAEAEYARLRAGWEAEEAARLRRAQAEAEGATTSTSEGTGVPGPPPTPSATPTTVLPGEVGPFPSAVERWRPLVARYFPTELVAQALAVIACESLGDPAVVNPLSGTAGLFQHHPEYWADRAAAAGFPGATPDDPEANIAAAAWLVGESMTDGLGPWFFWACRP
jgi:hypothetical protein